VFVTVTEIHLSIYDTFDKVLTCYFVIFLNTHGTIVSNSYRHKIHFTLN